MGIRTIGLPIVCAALAATTASCDQDLRLAESQELRPLAVLEGTVLYHGPRPCTRAGHVVGAAVLMLFDSNGLPPPEGLSPSLANFVAVPGDTLFADLIPSLPAEADGALACPSPDEPPVTASAPFVIAPVEAGTYQIRAFYDLDGDWFPTFDYSNLPTQGDIGGGTIANVDAFLQGESPSYETMTVGQPDDQGGLQIPATGLRMKNLTVTLARPYPLQRPYFYYGGVVDQVYGNQDPSHVDMPADYWAPDLSLLATESSLLRVQLYAGVPDNERKQAQGKPFFLHLDEPSLAAYRYDFNGDGVIGAGDNVPESSLVPALMPLVIWTKTDASDPTGSTAQSNPTVVDLGLTMVRDSLLQTAGFSSVEPVFFDHLTIAVRPAVICIDSSESPPLVAVVTPHETDQLTANEPDPAKQNKLFGDDPSAIKGAVAGLIGTTADRVEVIYACMPPGRYSANAIYTTGQVWSVPNELGYCLPREQPVGDPSNPTACGSRPRLPSQSVTLRIGGTADDPNACYDQFPSDAQRKRYMRNCLTEAERERFATRSLFEKR